MPGPSILELSPVFFAAHCDRCDRVEFGEDDREAIAILNAHACGDRRARPRWDLDRVEAFAIPTPGDLDPLDSLF